MRLKYNNFFKNYKHHNIMEKDFKRLTYNFEFFIGFLSYISE